MEPNTKEQIILDIIHKRLLSEFTIGYQKADIVKAFQEYADQQTAPLKAECERLREALQGMIDAYEWDGQSEGENQACAKAKKALNNLI